MAVKNLSTRNLEKFIQIQKNLSKPNPKLWRDSNVAKSSSRDKNGVNILQLCHPILQLLDSISPNVYQFKQVHAQMVVLGLIQYPLAASRAIKKLCSLQSTIHHAVKVFDDLENPDAFLCNTVMIGFVKFNQPEKALDFYYNGMVKNCVFLNGYSFPVVVKACADLGSLREGEKIHSLSVKCGFELDLYFRNAVIRLYFVCGRVDDAQKVFDMSSESDFVTWNTMIDGFVKNGEVTVAREVFDGMRERDVFSWNSMISGYARAGLMSEAKELFEAMPSRDVVSWNCMIEGYARIGQKDGARLLFDRMGYQNVVSWNTMLALYVRLKDYNECLILFDKMMEREDGHVQPNEATLVSVLTSCAHLKNLERGKWIRSYIKCSPRIKPDALLMTSLLSMFSKCGEIDLAKEIFSEMPEKNVVTWNSMIAAYGMNGHGDRALETFLEMEKNRIGPNEATFTCVLSTCSHENMVLEGWYYFDVMQRVYDIKPNVEHYGCMVHLLSQLVKEVPKEAGDSLLEALRLASKTDSRMKLGEIVMNQLITKEPENIGPYVLLCHIYTSQGRLVDVENIRNAMKEKRTEFRSSHKRAMVSSILSEMGTKLKLFPFLTSI